MVEPTAGATDGNGTEDNSKTSAAATEQTRGIPVASNIPGYACTDFKGIMFELPVKYETIKLIGKGTYGSVISARNRDSGEQIAIKKLSHVEDLIDAKRVLREIIIMKNLVHENILGLLDVVYIPKEGEVLGDIYLVCELMETDLSRVIRSRQ